MTGIAEVVRVRLDFSYDGGDFAGWATQPGLRTVQGVMEDGLARIARVRPTLTVAGRTDAGVHAHHQVAHLELPRRTWDAWPGRSARTPGEAFVARLGRVLPPDIVVRSAVLVPETFDARFSAVERRYSYRLSDRPDTRDPLARRSVMWHPRLVDLDALTRASTSLTGLRDFAAFCRPRPRATTIRTLMEFGWERVAHGPDSDLLVATIRADAFCHCMVRSLVGAVLSVGDGRRDDAWLVEVAASPVRSSRIPVAPARGLTLEEVTYPPEADVGAQAERTRARRTLD